MKKLYLLAFLAYSIPAIAQTNPYKAEVNKKADALQSKVVAWRRDFHEHPELGNHEVRSSGARMTRWPTAQTLLVPHRTGNPQAGKPKCKPFANL